MAEISRKISHVEESMRDNAIFQTWTQKWGVIVRPAFRIDKVKFDFVEVGAEGKGNSFVVYMDTIRFGAQCLDNWAYDVLHDRRMEHILAAEAKAEEKYPKAYKYVTGENAEKSIGIMNASSGKGYCLNASDVKNGKKVFANIPVSFHDLRILSENFLRAYSARRKELEEIRIKAEAEQVKAIMEAKKSGNSATEEGNPFDETPVSNDTAPANEAPVPDVTENVTEKPVENKKSEPEYVQETFRAVSGLEDKGQFHELSAATANGEAVSVRFMKDKAVWYEPETWEKFQKHFKEARTGSSSRFMATGAWGKNGDAFYVTSM